MRALGRETEAQAVLEAMAAHAKAELKIPARIDYFATSLPDLLVFDEDIQEAKAARMNELLELANKTLNER